MTTDITAAVSAGYNLFRERVWGQLNVKQTYSDYKQAAMGDERQIATELQQPSLMSTVAGDDTNSMEEECHVVQLAESQEVFPVIARESSLQEADGNQPEALQDRHITAACPNNDMLDGHSSGIGDYRQQDSVSGDCQGSEQPAVGQELIEGPHAQGGRPPSGSSLSSGSNLGRCDEQQVQTSAIAATTSAAARHVPQPSRLETAPRVSKVKARQQQQQQQQLSSDDIVLQQAEEHRRKQRKHVERKAQMLARLLHGDGGQTCAVVYGLTTDAQQQQPVQRAVPTIASPRMHVEPFHLASSARHERYASEFAQRTAAERAAREEEDKRLRDVSYVRRRVDEEFGAAMAAASRAGHVHKPPPTQFTPFKLAIDGRMDEWHTRHAPLMSSEELELQKVHEEKQRLRQQMIEAQVAYKAAMSNPPPPAKPQSARVQGSATVMQPFKLQSSARHDEYVAGLKQRLAAEAEEETRQRPRQGRHRITADSRLMRSVEEYVRKARSFAGEAAAKADTLARSHSCDTEHTRKFVARPMPNMKSNHFRPDLSRVRPPTQPRQPALATDVRLGSCAIKPEDEISGNTAVLLSPDGVYDAFSASLRTGSNKFTRNPSLACRASDRGHAGGTHARVHRCAATLSTHTGAPAPTTSTHVEQAAPGHCSALDVEQGSLSGAGSSSSVKSGSSRYTEPAAALCEDNNGEGSPPT